MKVVINSLNKAFSLLEVLLVLSLAAVASLVAVHYYSEVRINEQVESLAETYTAIYNAANACVQVNIPNEASYDSTSQGCQAVSSDPHYGNCFCTGYLIQHGYLASTYEINAWGGDNKTMPTSSGDVLGDFYVNAYNVPLKICQRLEDAVISGAKLPMASKVNEDSQGTKCVFFAVIQNNPSAY